MNPPAPTPAPLHDIVGPVWFWPYPIWMTITAAVAALIGLIVVIWLLKKLLVRKKPPLTNKQQAVAMLETLRNKMKETDPYDFGVSVSDVVRKYIQAEYGLQATKQTSLEFLAAIQSISVFSDNEKSGISVLLERTDLLKYARAVAGEPEMLDLLETAVRLVRGEAQSHQTKER